MVATAAVILPEDSLKTAWGKLNRCWTLLLILSFAEHSSWVSERIRLTTWTPGSCCLLLRKISNHWRSEAVHSTPSQRKLPLQCMPKAGSSPHFYDIFCSLLCLPKVYKVPEVREHSPLTFVLYLWHLVPLWEQKGIMVVKSIHLRAKLTSNPSHLSQVPTYLTISIFGTLCWWRNFKLQFISSLPNRKPNKWFFALEPIGFMSS